MPYKEWAVGEEVLAADFNPVVAQQVVPVFDNAAARDAAILTHQEGQLCHLKSFKGVLFQKVGSSWWPMSMPVRAGTGSYTTNASGIFTVTWTALIPGTVSVNDYACLATSADGYLGPATFGLIALTANSLQLVAWGAGGAAAASVTIKASWSIQLRSAITQP